MERQLNDGQATAILSLVQKRDEIAAAIEELVELYAAKYGLEGATVQQRGGALWLVVEDEVH